MALRKATSKRTKSGAPVSPLEMEPLARTMSGRQRRPTEKASYQGLELQQVIHRQARKQDKLKKWQKKVLKTAYQNDPDHFEKEPSVLLSNIDKEEDTMFSDHSVQTKLSKPKLLTFSMGKIPKASRTTTPTTSARKSTKGPKAKRVVPPSDRDLDGTSDGTSTTSDEDGDTAMESSMAARGTKRCLDTAPEDAMIRPKIKKELDGSCLKVSDFDDISKEVLVMAVSIFRCLLVMHAPFPDTIAVEMKLAKEAWNESCKIKGANIKLTPSAMKMEVIRHNRDQAKSLKEGSSFVFKDWTSKTGIYKTKLLQEGINIMWFANRNDEGIIYYKYFNPIPTEVRCTRSDSRESHPIECCIDKWAQGLKEDIKFTSATYGSVYKGHLASLQRFQQHTAPYKLLEKICDNLHDTARFHAGVEPLAMISAAPHQINDNTFEDAIREYQLEEQDNVEDNEIAAAVVVTTYIGARGRTDLEATLVTHDRSVSLCALSWNVVYFHEHTVQGSNNLVDRRSGSFALMPAPPLQLTVAPCRHVSWIVFVIWDWAYAVAFAMLEVIMIARLHAMYQRSRKILILLVVTFLAFNLFNGMVMVMETVQGSGEELILSGTYQCTVVYAEDTLLLDGIAWILVTVWEVFALCLAVWIAGKHFREMRQHSAGGIVGDCFRVLMKTHMFYFASFVAVCCLSLIDSSSVCQSVTDPYMRPQFIISIGPILSPGMVVSSQILQVVQMVVLGPRLILGVREYHAKLVADSDAATGMTSIAFQERVHISTGNGV
ncbi:hypothetical protein DFJ58DRAFT_864495 [Suillus subalutaceus]|uniref:uncharacterized protein n=1 Tax=Suillus subalutaceus TaxID=48586 RepID=UPI001B8801D3|nr:uncharacterized protein DFJ58DRAFT_864495 [Suillus subalutaceus]KAG1865455.1 hypothetical protein DFJ58DRAFT_864495 [Suillus subalutaceus]